MIIEVKTRHNLGKESAKNKLINEIPIIQEKYSEQLKNLIINWVDQDNFNTEFSVMGVKFKGSGIILENELVSKLELTGAAKLFHNRIKQALESKLSQILS